MAEAAAGDEDKPASPPRRVADPEVAERFRRLRDTGDRRLRNELIEEHRWVAIHCARRFNNRGEPLDDLIQVGQLGLLKAVNRFDPEVGVSFASYAIPTVMGELRRHFRDATWAVKVPRRIKDLHVDIAGAVEYLNSENGRPPKPQELATHLGVSVDAILEALEAGAGYRPGSLTPGGDSDRETALEGSYLKVEDPALEGADDRVLVRELLAQLPERERRIVELRFFSGLSQSEIADQVGVSQVHVSRLLRSSLAQLQRAMGDAVGDLVGRDEDYSDLDSD
jgi:RNA polymerase sigma-B factor